MQHHLRGRPVVPPPLRSLQRLPERHHAEREEPAELRALSPQVRRGAHVPAAGGAPAPFDSTCLCLRRDEGLSSSRAQIALDDHTSLFQDSKQQLDGSVSPSLHWKRCVPSSDLNICPSPPPCRVGLGQRSVSGGRPERLLRLHPLLRQRGRGRPAPPRGMLGEPGGPFRKKAAHARWG